MNFVTKNYHNQLKGCEKIMRSTARVGYDQNTKQYYYIPGCSHNECCEWEEGCNDDCYNNYYDDSCEESCSDWSEECRGCDSRNSQSKDQINDNNESSQSNSNQNLQNVNTRCGIQAWIKNAQAATPAGERIVFNVIREHQYNSCRIYYDEETNEFVFNQEGAYIVQWSVNVTPSSCLGTAYLTFTLNYDGDSEVLSRVYTAYQGINGTPNILNKSSVIFNANKDDRFSLNNASDGLINIGSLNSAIGGNLSILRIT